MGNTLNGLKTTVGEKAKMGKYDGFVRLECWYYCWLLLDFSVYIKELKTTVGDEA